MKIIKNPYKGFYATITDCSDVDEIEINYFEKKEDFWKLKEYNLDMRSVDEIELVPLNEISFYWGGLLRFYK